jgi:hypothetical protein
MGGRVEPAGEPGISAQLLEVGLGVAGHLRLCTGGGGFGHCILEHDRPGHAPPGLGLTMEATRSGSNLDPQQRVHGRATGHELAWLV